MVGELELEVNCRVIGAWRPWLLLRLMPLLNRLPEGAAIWIICYVIRGFGADLKVGRERHATKLRAAMRRAGAD